MGYKHRTKSGRTITFKNKSSFDRWQKGMFAGMKTSKSSPKRFKTGKGRAKIKFQDRDTGEESTRTVKLKKQTLRGRIQDRRMDSRKLRLSTPPGSEHVGDSGYEIDQQFEHVDEKWWMKEKKPRKKLKQVRVVQISMEQRVENIKKEKQKQKRKEKQEQFDLQFIQAGITEKDVKDSQMDRAQIKRLIKRAVDNGAKASDVSDMIDFDTTFDNNVRRNPLFVKDLESKILKRELSDDEREFAENYFIQKANESKKPEKYIQDSKKTEEPVRDTITKVWLKSPTSKEGGDISGVDDGNIKIDLKKFEKSFSKEDKEFLIELRKADNDALYQSSKSQVNHQINSIPDTTLRKEKQQQFNRFVQTIEKQDLGKQERIEREKQAIQHVREVTKRQVEREQRRKSKKNKTR